MELLEIYMRGQRTQIDSIRILHNLGLCWNDMDNSGLCPKWIDDAGERWDVYTYCSHLLGVSNEANKCSPFLESFRLKYSPAMIFSMASALDPKQ